MISNSFPFFFIFSTVFDACGRRKHFVYTKKSFHRRTSPSFAAALLGEEHLIEGAMRRCAERNIFHSSRCREEWKKIRNWVCRKTSIFVSGEWSSLFLWTSIFFSFKVAKNTQSRHQPRYPRPYSSREGTFFFCELKGEQMSTFTFQSHTSRKKNLFVQVSWECARLLTANTLREIAQEKKTKRERKTWKTDRDKKTLLHNLWKEKTLVKRRKRERQR